MRFKLLAAPILTVSLILAALPGFSQTIAPYQGKVLPFAIGFGPSGFEPDWGRGRMYGGTAWVDWYPSFIPRSLNKLDIEFEVRDISLDRHIVTGGTPRSNQANTKEDTAGGGFMYNWHLVRNLNFYAKAIVADGSVDFIGSPTYNHDTRIVLAPGGGLEYRVYGPISARVDYEYQIWTGKLIGTYLTPQGFTAGITYDFAHPTP